MFLRGGWDELRARQPGMMLLISLGLLVAFGASVATEFGWIDVDLWFELSTLVTVMLLGHWLEMRAIGQAQGALAALAELLPDEAERVTPERRRDRSRSTRSASATSSWFAPAVASRPTGSSSTATPSSTSR